MVSALSENQMRIRVGIDLVSVDEVRDSIDRHGDRYLQRVYSPSELADCARAGTINVRGLAARFAAKEATFKVLRAGDDAIGWHEVEMHSGGARLLLRGQAARLADQAGIEELSLSVSQLGELAMAVVIAEPVAPRGYVI